MPKAKESSPSKVPASFAPATAAAKAEAKAAKEPKSTGDEAAGEANQQEEVPDEASVLVLQKIQELITQGAETAADEKESAEAGLAPARQLRLRKKSKQLEEECKKLMNDSLESVFNEFDTDGSGTLEQEELKAAFGKAKMPCSMEQLASAMEKLDTDGDGKISLEECAPRSGRPSLAPFPMRLPAPALVILQP